MSKTKVEAQREPELLSCPFCGSNSVVWSEHFRRVRCNRCYIGTAPLGNHPYKPETLISLKAQSIAAWNTRSRPTEAAAQIDLAHCIHCEESIGVFHRISMLERCYEGHLYLEEARDTFMAAIQPSKPSTADRDHLLDEATAALREFVRWYAVDSSEFNRDNAYESARAVLAKIDAAERK